MVNLPLFAGFHTSQVVIAGFPSTVAFKHMELDPWQTSPDSPESREAQEEKEDDTASDPRWKLLRNQTAVQACLVSNSCRVSFKCSRLAVKHRKPGSGNSILMGNFANPEKKKTPITFCILLVGSFGHLKNTTRPAGETTISRCCQVSESRPGTPGFLSSKSHPAYKAISRRKCLKTWLWWVW